MTMGSFPSDQSRRRVILVLNSHDIERCLYERDSAKSLLDEELHVLSHPLQLNDNAPSALQEISRAGKARPGSILIQSPFDSDVYEEAAIAAERFALAKNMYFSTLCMHLGAKEVIVEQIELNSSSGKTTMDLKGGARGVKASAAIDSEKIEKLQEEMHLRDEFEGGPPDVIAADRLLRRTGLGSDPNMRSLFEMRRDGTNQIKSRRLVLSLSREAQNNLKVAGRLSVAMPTFISISGDYKNLVSNHHEYKLTITVNF
jgi:hypothetical protein